jgi:D-3-phosphoglycerate dehydrogenase
MKILVTCPPMLGMMDQLRPHFIAANTDVHCPHVVQILSEAELIELVPQFDGWIIGDDPATRAVFAAGRGGRLKAAIKWGIGVDNVDFAACREFGIPISNTPMMFGGEVADLAMSYVVSLARETYLIHEGIKAGQWPKRCGMSLARKTVGLVGFGDVGRNFAVRALAADMNVVAYDPGFSPVAGMEIVELAPWPERLHECDFLVFTCALTSSNRHMLNAEVLRTAKQNLRIVNVARGPLIDEEALVEAIAAGRVHSAALDVFEVEPLPLTSRLRDFECCIFGSHNGSNTVDAVIRASERAIGLLFGYLGITPAPGQEAT